jgi:hypothetical protein
MAAVISIVVVLAGEVRTAIECESIPIEKLAGDTQQYFVIHQGHIHHGGRRFHVVVAHSVFHRTLEVIHGLLRHEQDSTARGIFSEECALRAGRDLHTLKIVEKPWSRTAGRYIGEISYDTGTAAGQDGTGTRAACGSHAAQREGVIVARDTARHIERWDVILQIFRGLDAASADVARRQGSDGHGYCIKAFFATPGGDGNFFQPARIAVLCDRGLRVDSAGSQSSGGRKMLRRRRARACGMSRGRIARLVGYHNDDGLLVCLSVSESCPGQQSAHRLIEVQLRIECLSHQSVHQGAIEENIGLRLACYGA